MSTFARDIEELYAGLAASALLGVMVGDGALTHTFAAGERIMLWTSTVPAWESSDAGSIPVYLSLGTVRPWVYAVAYYPIIPIRSEYTYYVAPPGGLAGMIHHLRPGVEVSVYAVHLTG